VKIGTDEHGHRTLDGARWHFPSNNDPAVCGEKGCDYVMRAYRDKTEESPKPKFKRRKRG
jgi:hypothetical protein